MRVQFKTCIQCGEKFSGDYSHGKDAWRKRKYCSTKCKKEAQSGRWLRLTYLTKACEECGRKFRNRRANGALIASNKWAKAKYCSPECKWAASRGKEAHNKGKRMDLREQFFRHVDKSDLKGCWIWTGTRSAAGYGGLQVNGMKTSAHRISYMIHHGEIPEGDGFHGTVVCHKCDNPSCVNPDHLFLGSQYANMQDRDAKGRRIPARGAKHGMSKLSDRDAQTIIEIAKTRRHTQKEIARMFGVSNSLISLIINRKNWTHI